MKYYEISLPYYALLIAENEEQAAQVYIEEVAGDEDELEFILDQIELVDSDYAERKILDIFEENNEEVNLKEFKTPQSILIDNCLV